MSSSFNTGTFAHDAKPEITILPAGQEARDEFGHRYGSQRAILTTEQIEALRSGYQLAVEIMDGEYVLFLTGTGE